MTISSTYKYMQNVPYGQLRVVQCNEGTSSSSRSFATAS